MRTVSRHDRYLPVHEDAASRIKSILDELVGVRKGLQEVFIVDIVHFYDLLLEASEQLCIGVESQDGQDMCDASRLQRLSSPQREEPTRYQSLAVARMGGMAAWAGASTHPPMYNSSSPCTLSSSDIVAQRKDVPSKI